MHSHSPVQSRTCWRMRILTSTVVAFATLSSVLSPAASASNSIPVVSADLKIQFAAATSKATATSMLTLTQITVQNDNDDDARDVQVVVSLPPTSHIVSAPANAVPGTSYADPSTRWPTVGEVVISLGTLPVGQSATLSLTTEMLAQTVSPATSIGVFVYGSLPDPNTANNFRSLPVHN